MKWRNEGIQYAGLQVWRDVTKRQGMPAATRNWKRQEADSPLQSAEGILLPP